MNAASPRRSIVNKPSVPTAIPDEALAPADGGAIPDSCPQCASSPAPASAAETVAEIPEAADRPSVQIVETLGELNPSKAPLAIGRKLHAYSAYWQGPRPAEIVNVVANGIVNVNISFDYSQDGRTAFQPHPAQTHTSVPVFDELHPHQRDVFIRGQYLWCEWPPRD
jgi:hypothetical protein